MSAAAAMRIAFIGLGNMGVPMAANLAAAGHEVRGFDLAPGARTAAAEAGAMLAASAVEAVDGAEAVITMLPHGAAVLAVYDEIVPAAAAGSLLIDCSTVDVESAREAHRRAEAAGLASVDAPVSGGVMGARNGTLTFMAGGEAEALDRAEPVLAPMAGRVVRCGGPSAGQAAKICNNMLLASSMIGAGEAFNLGRRLGLEDQALFDVISTASGQCWSVNTYCPVPGPVPTSPANDGYKPGFAVDLMAKDLGLAAEAAEAAGAATPLGSAARALYDEYRAEGHGGADFSGIIRMLAERSKG